MQAANNNVDEVPVTEAQLPSGDALPAAFLELKKQLDVQSELIIKKSDVISHQRVRLDLNVICSMLYKQWKVYRGSKL